MKAMSADARREIMRVVRTRWQNRELCEVQTAVNGWLKQDYIGDVAEYHSDNVQQTLSRLDDDGIIVRAESLEPGKPGICMTVAPADRVEEGGQ